MPRRKSLIAQMYEARQKAKLQQQKLEEQATRAWAAEERRVAAQQEKEAAQQRLEAEVAAQARLRQEQQAERTREQQASEADRRRRTVERRSAEAEFKTEAVQATIAAFERLLTDRNRHLAAHSGRAEAAFGSDGAEAFVAGVQRALATSVYPEGLDGSCAAQYIPESRELWVEYELPRQDVIPAVTGYRYVKTKDVIQPDPRKEP